MINYSLFQPEVIFADWDEFNPHYEEFTTLEGVTLQLERSDDNQLRVSRLYSTDPQDYLNKKYSPGLIYNTGLQI